MKTDRLKVDSEARIKDKKRSITKTYDGKGQASLQTETGTMLYILLE